MKTVGIVLATIVGLFVVVLAIGALSGPPGEESQARTAISLCWNDQSKKSLEPDAARFIAGACEMMERSFTEKYHRKP